MLFYEESGFPEARVRGRALPEDDDEVDLELTVNEGQPILVTGIEIFDWPFTKPSVADLIKDLPQEVGKPCDRSEVEKSRETIRQRLVEKSHWKAVVHDTILVADFRAKVQFRVEPGPAYQMRQGGARRFGEEEPGRPPASAGGRRVPVRSRRSLRSRGDRRLRAGT